MITRRLLLIRHAKSSWKNVDVDDHERPLSNRGQGDAITMARHLADRDEALDVLFSSTATRALDFAQTISDFTHISLVPELSFYTFDTDELLQILRSLPDSAMRVGVVAHNPAITEAVNRLTARDIDNVPTAGIAAIDCPIDNWSELRDGYCDLDYFEYPKMLS